MLPVATFGQLLGNIFQQQIYLLLIDRSAAHTIRINVTVKFWPSKLVIIAFYLHFPYCKVFRQ
jgi:hypothetical protein